MADDRTYDVVAGFDGWAYGDTPVLVATRRPLQAEVSTVRAVAGGIDALLDDAQAVASGRDVYVDGGDLVQQALAADRVDELIVTVVPVLLGAGVRLFGPLSTRQAWAFEAPEPYGTMVQLRARRQR